MEDRKNGDSAKTEKDLWKIKDIEQSNEEKLGSFKFVEGEMKIKEITSKEIAIVLADSNQEIPVTAKTSVQQNVEVEGSEFHC